MAKKKKRCFDDLAHVGRLYVGRCIETPAGKCARRVSPRQMHEVLRVAQTGGPGGMTTMPARGVYVPGKKAATREPSSTIEFVSNARGDSCARFHGRMRAIAARAARIAEQDTVLAVSWCSDGVVQGDFVHGNGTTAAWWPESKLRHTKPRDESGE